MKTERFRSRAQHYTGGAALRPKIRNTTNSTKNKKNKIFAMPTAAPAIPVKPSRPAMIAMTKNVIAQPSIWLTSFQIFNKNTKQTTKKHTNQPTNQQKRENKKRDILVC